MKLLKYHRWFPEPWRLKFSFGLWHFESGYSFNFLGLWIRLPIEPRNDPKDICDRWGFSYCDRGIQLSFGGPTKIFWMPWDFGSCVEHTVQNEFGVFVKPSEEYSAPYSDGRKLYQEPYTYQLKNGEIQNRTATFYVEYREWRWKFFHGLPFKFGPAIKRKCISINFDGEVGELTGSWKGGTTGCGYEMLPNETPVETLRRMERERVFN